MTLQDQPIVDLQDRRARRPDRVEALEAGGFDEALGFLQRSTALHAAQHRHAPGLEQVCVAELTQSAPAPGAHARG